MAAMFNQNTVLIVGNDKLSQQITNEGKQFISISSREFINMNDPTDLTPSHGHLDAVIYSGQLTRRHKYHDLAKFNEQLTGQVIKLSAFAKRLLFVSSIDVFGSSPVMPLTSNASVEPFDVYSQSKVDSEVRLSREANCKVINIRLPGLYGQSVEEGSVIARMVLSAINDSAITLTAPHITRPFLSYYGAARFIGELLNIPNPNRNYTVGPNKSISLLETATQIKQLLNGRYKHSVLLQLSSTREFDTSGGRSANITTDWSNEYSSLGFSYLEQINPSIDVAVRNFLNCAKIALN